MERYNEIMAFLKQSKVSPKSDRTFFDEITNMMWIEMTETGESATELLYDRVLHRRKRFYSTKGITRREITTSDIFNARDAHLKTHPPCAEDDLVALLDEDTRVRDNRWKRVVPYPMTQEDFTKHKKRRRRLRRENRKRKIAGI